jgi:hypothetical protein
MLHFHETSKRKRVLQIKSKENSLAHLMNVRLSNEGLLLGFDTPSSGPPFTCLTGVGRILWNLSFHTELETTHSGYAKKTLRQEHTEIDDGKRIEVESLYSR